MCEYRTLWLVLYGGMVRGGKRMRLYDNGTEREFKIGDTIRDDFGGVWFVVGFSEHGIQLADVGKLSKITESYGLDVFSVKVGV
jgi:hypothetical protein